MAMGLNDMKRRSFLSMLGAASAAPLMPTPVLGAISRAASYNRFSYGYAVFWARHGGAFGVQQLAKAMQISETQAKAMIDEMLQDRLVRASQAGVQSVSTHGGHTRARRSQSTKSKTRLYWRFRRVGLRARALNWQLLCTHTSSAPMRATV